MSKQIAEEAAKAAAANALLQEATNAYTEAKAKFWEVDQEQYTRLKAEIASAQAELETFEPQAAAYAQELKEATTSLAESSILLLTAELNLEKANVKAKQYEAECYRDAYAKEKVRSAESDLAK